MSTESKSASVLEALAIGGLGFSFVVVKVTAVTWPLSTDDRKFWGAPQVWSASGFNSQGLTKTFGVQLPSPTFVRCTKR